MMRLRDVAQRLRELRYSSTAHNALGLLSATAFDRASLLVISAVLARVLSTADFASFALALALASIATRVGDGGLAISSIRMLAQEPNKTPEIVGTSTTMRLGILAAAGLFVILVASVAGYTKTILYAALGLTGALSTAGLAQLVLTPLRAQGRLVREAIANAAGTTARLICFGVCVLLSSGSPSPIVVAG